MITTIKIYVDLDGVLADFRGAVAARLGGTMDELPRKVMWSRLQRYNDQVEPWFYSLPMMEDAMELWEFVIDNFENVEILSASGNTPRDAPGQKKAWIGEKLGWDVIANIVQSSGDKAAFADEKALLIDDSHRAVNPFKNAGGLTVLHTSAESTIAQLKVLMQDWD